MKTVESAPKAGTRLSRKQTAESRVNKETYGQECFASNSYDVEKLGLEGFVRFLLENRNKSLWVSK
jgi:hypothetical protein